MTLCSTNEMNTQIAPTLSTSDREPCASYRHHPVRWLLMISAMITAALLLLWITLSKAIQCLTKPVDSSFSARYGFLIIFFIILGLELHTLCLIINEHVDCCPMLSADPTVAFRTFCSHCHRRYLQLATQLPHWKAKISIKLKSGLALSNGLTEQKITIL